MYPIKNLEDLYDKEGYRDSEFKRVIKGCGRYIQISPKVIKQGGLSNEGMVLYLDRNTRTAKGHYFVKTFYEKNKFPDRKIIMLK